MRAEDWKRKEKKLNKVVIWGTVLLLAFCPLLEGCGKSAGEEPARTVKNQAGAAGVDDVLQAGMEKYDGEGESAEKDAPAQKTGSAKESADTGEVDVDLTSLSSTIVYSEVYNMMSEPEQYVGKTVKMNGTYVVYHIESTNTDYFACIIQDATACCSQGMEFVLDDSYAYPEDYPAEGSEITVVGTFDTYMEDDYLYCTLRDAKLVSG